MDIDLKNPLLYQIKVDNDGECGFVNVEYENIPDFCTTCSSIGHSAARCKKNQSLEKKVDTTKQAKPSENKAAGKKVVFKFDSDEDSCVDTT